MLYMASENGFAWGYFIPLSGVSEVMGPYGPNW